MAALREQWQAQRLQRQQAIVERQQTVKASLATLHQQRQHQAMATREQLEQHHAAVQAETSLWLTQVHQARLVQAQQMAQDLNNYCCKLQAETAHFLAVTADVRSQVAVELHLDLTQFHRALQALVKEMRLDLQQQLRVMQADVAQSLSEHHDARFQMDEQTRAELARYLASLRAEISTYLAALAQTRQIQAVELRHQLSQDRQTSIETVNAMFEQLVNFRQELMDYRRGLTQGVWGEAHPTDQAAATAPVALPKTTTAHRVNSATKTQPLTAPQLGKPPVSVPAVVPHSKVNPEAVRPVVVQPVKPSRTELIEEAVYQYLHANTAAKLTEIESTLEINRFQAVEALRSLIQKSLIVQRDRVYRINEEALL